MVNVFDKNTPSPQLLQDIMRKVNALGHEPRVVIELDKVSYVPGMKSRFEVWDRIREASLTAVSSNAELTSPLTEEPGASGSGGESGDRFEYIKCAFNKWAKNYKLPDQAYYFLLAVAKHETAFGTLGQGRLQNGSFIVGYGCPGSCDPTYSGIDTQAKYAAKRYSDAMKSRYSKINSNGRMDASDIDYFHEGGDKGYGRWVWSADGANWKNRVKQYYDSIRTQAKQAAYRTKWHCKESGSIGTPHMTHVNHSTKIEDCNCDKDSEIYTIEDQQLEVNASVASSGGGGLTTSVFPIEGYNFENAKVSSPYGKRGSSFHKGIDLTDKKSGSAGINGKWVIAAWAGVVARAYRSTSYGNVVMIQHGNGYMTVYAHMQEGSLQVRAGQEVNAGTRLGKVGNTGNSFGAHLHFEIWKGEWKYGGTNHINPYYSLLGTQRLGVAPVTSSSSDGVGGGATPKPKPKTVVHNIKFNKCFDKDASLDKNWISKENIKHFTSTKTGERYVGFSGNVPRGGVKDFGYKHNFSADGYYEYSYFADLKEGDSVTVTYDGMVAKRYTKSDNTSQPTYESPIYAKHTPSEIEGANSHILDFTIDNVSGQAVFGLKCFKVVEVENAFVTEDSITARKRDVWLETGAFVYDTTYTLEDDITEWEVNTHFDSRVGTARFTLNNKHGVYSPSYERTTIFPDNRRPSEMSYYENGGIRHVLSEATPVRIYAGYGENLVRVFTGKIKGEIEEDSETKTITVNCVDMYDSLEEHVFDRILTFPRREEIHGDEKNLELWVKSAIVHNIVNEAGLIGWRIHQDDLQYADTVIEETYYIDIDRGGKEAVVWDSKKRQYVKKKIATVKDAYGYKNPYVQSIDFQEGTRAADAIQELIGDIMYRAFCDRYGTFRLENIRNLTAANAKWEFEDGKNLESLTTAIDHSRVRNHLMIVGSGGQIEHFVDKDLLISTKGNMRTAKVVSDWIDESYGSNARGIKEEVASRLFFDMKRQARTLNVAVKGNPMIEVLDGVYIYDSNTSTAGYYIIKGNKLTGNKEGMVNVLEVTWEDTESYYEDKPIYNIPPETSREDVEGVVKCGAQVNAGSKKASFTHSVTTNGYVYVTWNMYGVPDKISIYVGGKLRWTTGQRVSNGDGGPIGFYYKKSQGKIEVKINDGLTVNYGTDWKYTLYCPGTAPKSVTDKAKLV
ncbi:M23 family metallopeptidase [Bacillus licheniformis]|uniref:M23 family metallopeptidase n=1 Tax=Bacillus licheniformis TaxID=1402 RepID=UPI0020C8FE5D|nr:M23 family metallopeptidase [Bacillus licheniformis]MCP8973172.1 M23 family metallopeptidase [Bacillus licheniformis]